MFLFLEQFYVLCLKSYVIKMLEFFSPLIFCGQSGLSAFLLSGALFDLAPQNRAPHARVTSELLDKTASCLSATVLASR